VERARSAAEESREALSGPHLPPHAKPSPQPCELDRAFAILARTSLEVTCSSCRSLWRPTAFNSRTSATLVILPGIFLVVRFGYLVFL
jgi:hypothetical protein